MVRLVRGTIFHTPQNPFIADKALEVYEDGALVYDETVIALGDHQTLRARHPDAESTEYSGAYILPGFIDTHVHYPQIPVLGAMGLRLLDWLETRTLPEESKFADADYARKAAKTFLAQLARSGTTTALVFGAHFATAMDVFFDEAIKTGLRLSSGLVLADRMLTDALHTSAKKAYEENKMLIERWHNKGRLRYAVTPRFSLSCSDELLAVCGDLLSETPDLLFTSHINEQLDEISTVLNLFENARDYLETYEAHKLLGERTVLAHNVHVTDNELVRIAASKTSIAHCPSSNMFIGSGLFPLKRHLEKNINVALGSDVGGGTGFSLFKEGLMAYQAQMLREDGYPLSAAHLLYLATVAGAKALQLGETVGDFQQGKAADFIVVKPPNKSTLAATLEHSPSAEASLASLFTLAREDSIISVYVGGERLTL